MCHAKYFYSARLCVESGFALFSTKVNGNTHLSVYYIVKKKGYFLNKQTSPHICDEYFYVQSLYYIVLTRFSIIYYFAENIFLHVGRRA